MTSQGKILLVDDDTDICFMTKTILEHYGYSVTALPNGASVKETLRENDFDLLIIDMLLSGANGIEICRDIKNSPQTSSLPVMIMTAHPNARILCKDSGCSDFLVKPFEMKELLDKVSQLVSGGEK